MSERLTPALLANAKGMAIPPVKNQVRGKSIVAFAESIGSKDPRYTGESPIAHPAYVGAFVVKALFNLADVVLKNDKGEDVKLILNALKVVHGGQNYKFTGVPVKDGDLLTTDGVLDDLYIKNEMLFVFAKCVTKNQDGKVVLETTLSAIFRKGGF